MELENEKTESVNENGNKENKNVDEFQEYILQQKPRNTKVETQSDMKAWNAIIKSFINQTSSVKMAEYWPRSLFALLWTSTSSRCIKTQIKKRTWPTYSHLDRTSVVNNINRSITVHTIYYRIHTYITVYTHITYITLSYILMALPKEHTVCFLTAGQGNEDSGNKVIYLGCVMIRMISKIIPFDGPNSSINFSQKHNSNSTTSRNID